MDDAVVSNFLMFSLEGSVVKLPVAENIFFISVFVFLKKFREEILPTGLFRFD